MSTPIRDYFLVQAQGKDSAIKNPGACLNETDASGQTSYVGFTASEDAAEVWRTGGSLPADLIGPVHLGR